MSMSLDLSALASRSAEHSLKRSRMLFDVDPQAAFLPSADPTITQLSLARRKRRSRMQGSRKQSPSSSNALALLTDTGKASMKPNGAGSESVTSSALVTKADAAHEPNPGGILVVSRELNFLNGILQNKSDVLTYVAWSNFLHPSPTLIKIVRNPSPIRN